MHIAYQVPRYLITNNYEAKMYLQIIKSYLPNFILQSNDDFQNQLFHL